MKHKEKIYLVISIISIAFGIWLIFQKNTDSRITNYALGGNSVTIIDISKEGKKPNYLYLVSGALMILISSVYLGKRFFKNKKENAFKKLTDRERFIVSLIEQGMSNKDIGNELSISVSTVKTHINNIYKKLNITSRADMLRYLKSMGSSTKIHP